MRYLKPHWTQSWATCSSWPYLNKEVGRWCQEVHYGLKISVILWFLNPSLHPTLHELQQAFSVSKTVGFDIPATIQLLQHVVYFAIWNHIQYKEYCIAFQECVNKMRKGRDWRDIENLTHKYLNVLYCPYRCHQIWWLWEGHVGQTFYRSPI